MEGAATIYTVASGVLTNLWTIAGSVIEAGFSNPVTAIPLATGLASCAVGLIYMVGNVFRRGM